MNLTRKKYDASKYDVELEFTIPNLELMHSIISKILSAWSGEFSDPIKVLDLGIGTGRMIRIALDSGVKGVFVGVDTDADMMKHALLLEAGNSKFELMVADLNDPEFWVSLTKSNEKYDLVVSGYTLHHFSLDERNQVYENVFKLLNDDGILVNQDLYCSSLDFVSKLALQMELRFIEKQFRENDLEGLMDSKDLLSMRKPVSSDSIAPDFWIDHYSNHTELIPIAKELELLTCVHFEQVDCVYRHLQNAIIVARK